MKLLERDVSKAIKEFMQLRGWRPLRMQSGTFTNPQFSSFRVGEPGMPDYLFLYYLQDSECVALWVEMKRPGDSGKCRCADGKLCRVCRQTKWRVDELLRGAVVVQARSLEEFAGWYEKYFAWLHGPDAPRKGTQQSMRFGG